VLIDGQDVRERPPAELRRGIGYVIQQAGLFPHRTIVDNIATVPFLLGWDKKRARARARELMERVGLDVRMAKRYPYQLSGGQQQRVGVARALAADPPIMLMDEPFSAVDPVVRAELQAEFLRLQDELEKTIVFVTHDIDEAIKLGDRIAVFRTGGKLVQYDTPAAILANPADEFVAGFVGRDRGIRLLSFVGSDRLPLDSSIQVRAATLITDAGDAPWVLVVDGIGRPLGWASAPARAAAREAGEQTLEGVRLEPVGATFTVGVDSARSALDSAILSAASQAVGVDSEGVVVGTVPLTKIKDHEVAATPVIEDGVS
jgi:osmoprotectant transport system ATP-binding protein